MNTSSQVLHSVSNGIATIVLNRPKALNSLNSYMVTKMRDLLHEWAGSVSSCPTGQSGVNCIVVKGAGGKAFCAGGDVKAAVAASQSGTPPGEPLDFFTTEYTLDLEISQLPIPYIALADGIVMGGGAGLAMNGVFCVVTERSVFAMPEAAIGLFPDVGASYFLQHRVPEHLGLYLALTGARLNGVDIKQSGLASHFVASSRLPQLEGALQELGPQARDLSVVNGLLCKFEESTELPTSTSGSESSSSNDLSSILPHVQRHFSRASVAEVAASLEAARAEPGPSGRFALETLNLLNKGSPLTQLVAFEQLRRARHMTLQQALAMDTHLIQEFIRDQGDWFEGVRAVLVDRDNKPQWKYNTLQVPREVVQAFFPAVAAPAAASKL